MGIVLQQATFDAPAPAAAAIAARVTELVGLAVIVRDSPPEIREPLWDLLADIAFEAYPQAEIELMAYRAGAVKEHLRQTGMDALPIANIVQGVNEAQGKQTVYVRGYIGQELTLFLATMIALESLGGVLDEPMPEDMRRKYSCRVSIDELKRRHRKVNGLGFLALVGGALLLPILLPIWAVTIAWHVFTFPRRIWKARELLKNHVPGKPSSEA